MRPVNGNQSIQIAHKFAECCALKNYPPRRLYKRMMRVNRKRYNSNQTSFHTLRKSLQSIFRKPSTIHSIVESHPEVLQFLKEFQPELDQIINTTPKSLTWLSEDRVPRGYWDDMRNQRKFFDWIAIHSGFKTDEDWYHLTNNDVISLGGRGLLHKYNDSISKALQTIYPNEHWRPFLFDRVPQGYWDDIQHQRIFMDWVGLKLQYKADEDWYQLSHKDVISLGGRVLLDKYNSLAEALQTIYPEKHWQLFLFHSVPRGYWDDINNQRDFFEYIAAQRGFKTHNDWYQLTYKDVLLRGGGGLLDKYNNSISKALQTIYPGMPCANVVMLTIEERNWQLFLFQQVPHGYWNDRSNIMRYMDWLGEQLGIQTMEDWNSTAYLEISERRGVSLIHKFGSVLNLLKYCYPDYPWNQSRVSTTGQSVGQRHLQKIIRSIFKHRDVDVFHDYTHKEMIFSDTNRPMQFDIFIPQLKLAIEYHGEQHYGFHYLYGHPEEQQKRDAEKKAKCSEAGITLIEVPYWWDKTSASLLATIHQIRPDVISTDQVPQGAVPIPIKQQRIDKELSPPVSFFMLPTHWDSSIGPTGWWMSEMYNGVRALWNAEKKTFQLRNGITIQPPKTFTELLSKSTSDITQLDGVLWLGYGKQYDLAQRLQENNQDENLWRDIQYLVFDIPNSPYDSDERIAILKSLNIRKDSPLKVIDQIVCEGEEHLKKTLHEIEMKGGEGIILKLPKSPYKEGVSTSMMKVEIPPGRARIKSINTTSATCELPSGIVFDIPLTPAQSQLLLKARRPDIVVSFKQTDSGWNGITAPINPSLLAIRRDLSWENVLEESTPYFLAQGKQKGTPKCVGCKKSINKTQYRVNLRSLFFPVGKKPHTVLYQFCAKSECINKACGSSGNSKLIPKMEAVYVPSTLQLSEEKLQACEGLNLLSARPM